MRTPNREKAQRKKYQKAAENETLICEEDSEADSADETLEVLPEEVRRSPRKNIINGIPRMHKIEIIY